MITRIGRPILGLTDIRGIMANLEAAYYDPMDIYGEAINNSLQAGATVIKVSNSKEFLMIEDNGSGIRDIRQFITTGSQFKTEEGGYGFGLGVKAVSVAKADNVYLITKTTGPSQLYELIRSTSKNRFYDMLPSASSDELFSLNHTGTKLVLRNAQESSDVDAQAIQKHYTYALTGGVEIDFKGTRLQFQGTNLVKVDTLMTEAGQVDILSFDGEPSKPQVYALCGVWVGEIDRDTTKPVIINLPNLHKTPELFTGNKRLNSGSMKWSRTCRSILASLKRNNLLVEEVNDDERRDMEEYLTRLMASGLQRTKHGERVFRVRPQQPQTQPQYPNDFRRIRDPRNPLHLYWDGQPKFVHNLAHKAHSTVCQNPDRMVEFRYFLQRCCGIYDLFHKSGLTTDIIHTLNKAFEREDRAISNTSERRWLHRARIMRGEN